MAVSVAATVATSPGRMKLWFRRYFPMRVVPVRSNATAASTVPYVGRKKFPLTAGYEPRMSAGGRPRATATGPRMATVDGGEKHETGQLRLRA